MGASVSVTINVTAGTGTGVANTLTLTNVSGAGITNYPLQIGRPFVQGAIPNMPTFAGLMTQADVKNRYPDGSVAFAIMSTVISSLPAGSPVVLTVVDSSASGAGTVAGNIPLTQTEMLDPSYGFDAQMVFTNGANTGTASARAMLTAGNYTVWASGPIAQTILLADDSAAAAYDLSLDGGVTKSLRPRFAATFWPLTKQVQIRVVAENCRTDAAQDLSYTATVSIGTMPTQVYSADLSNGASGTLPNPLTGLSFVKSAAATTTGYMTTSGTASRAWTSGVHEFALIAATGEIVEVSWGGANQVYVWARGTNGTTAQPIPAGAAFVTGCPKKHWAFSNWTKRFWLGGAPADQVNIDNNLPYLVSTRWLPNYDTTVVPSPTQLTATYIGWTGRPSDIYDGTWNNGSAWQSAISSTGDRAEIGPNPLWHVFWLYTGDWRMRQMALGLTDIAGAFPGNLREAVAGKRLLRTDPVGASTGMGRTVSLTDRKTLVAENWTYQYTAASDAIKIVGPLNLSQPWGFDGAHQPQPFFIPYILTGDHWYLNQAYLWAGFTPAGANGAATTLVYGRGPTGAEGAICDQLRGAGWEIRSRCETAFMAPDADPEKVYLTTLANDALARWEGGFGITGTVYDGSTMKNWGASLGNFYTSNGGPVSGRPPALHNWESLYGESPPAANTGVFASGAVAGASSPWMQNYTMYALGRVKELGFAVGPILSWTASWLTSMLAYDPRFIVVYQMPVERASPDGFYTSWADVATGFDPAYLASGGGLDTRWQQNLFAAGYAGWVQAAVAMVEPEAGGSAAWNTYDTQVRQAINSSTQPQSNDPRWCIVPRTDTNVLPARPTT